MSATTETLFAAAPRTADAPKPVATPVQAGWNAFDVWRTRVWRRPDIANLVPAAVRPPDAEST